MKGLNDLLDDILGELKPGEEEGREEPSPRPGEPSGHPAQRGTAASGGEAPSSVAVADPPPVEPPRVGARPSAGAVAPPPPAQPARPRIPSQPQKPSSAPILPLARPPAVAAPPAAPATPVTPPAPPGPVTPAPVTPAAPPAAPRESPRPAAPPVRAGEIIAEEATWRGETPFDPEEAFDLEAASAPATHARAVSPAPTAHPAPPRPAGAEADARLAAEEAELEAGWDEQEPTPRAPVAAGAVRASTPSAPASAPPAPPVRSTPPAPPRSAPASPPTSKSAPAPASAPPRVTPTGFPTGRPSLPRDWVTRDVEEKEDRAPARSRRRRVIRIVAGIGVLALAAGALRFVVAREEPAPPEPPVAAPPPPQEVVAWSVWDQKPRGPAFVTVLAMGGNKPPLFLAIPATTIVSVPGRGLETFGDTASQADPDAVAAAAENVLGVQVDAATGMPLATLAELVDTIGGIELEDSEFGPIRFDGAGVVEYLRAGDASTEEEAADLRFVRWLEVGPAVLSKAAQRRFALDVVPPDLRPVFAAAGSSEVEVLDLPVEPIGAGLHRPEATSTADLIRRQFVPTSRTVGQVRIVVLNGVGQPGVGEQVSRLLVPAGFRLVSSQNAARFNVRETQIVAGSLEFMEDAELVRELLGVGEITVSDQPSLVADISIVVGRDFLRR